MAGRLITLLFGLCLSGTTLAGLNPRESNGQQTWKLQPLPDELFPPPGRVPEEDDLLKSYDQLKSLYNTLKQKLDSKLKTEERPRPKLFGSSNVAVDPLFLDLDNIEAFNDISSDDLTSSSTARPSSSSTSAPSTTILPTTSGPMIIGHDSLGRQILRFVNHWEEEVESTSTLESVSSFTVAAEKASTLPFIPTTSERRVVVPEFSFQEPLVTGPPPPVPIFVPISSTTPISNSLEDLNSQEPLIMGPMPPRSSRVRTTPPPRRDFDFSTTSFFSRSPLIEEVTTPLPFPRNREELEERGFSRITEVDSSTPAQALEEMKSSEEEIVEIPTIPSPFWTSPNPKSVPSTTIMVTTPRNIPRRIEPVLQSSARGPERPPALERSRNPNPSVEETFTEDQPRRGESPPKVESTSIPPRFQEQLISQGREEIHFERPPFPRRLETTPAQFRELNLLPSREEVSTQAPIPFERPLFPRRFETTTSPLTSFSFQDTEEPRIQAAIDGRREEAGPRNNPSAIFPEEEARTLPRRGEIPFPRSQSPTFEKLRNPPGLFEEVPRIGEIFQERNFPRLELSTSSPPFENALFARNLETGGSPRGEIQGLFQERNSPDSSTLTPIFPATEEERTFPSFITEIKGGAENFSGNFVTESSPIQTTTEDEVEPIWWTPKPSFLGMSSILSAPPPKPPPPRSPPLWHPRWKLTTPSSLATPQFIHPEVEERVQKVAEQSVINELELVAGSMNMSELVKELRGEQPLPSVIDSGMAHKLLETKKRTLKQLEILDHLANRKNELQQLIERQKAMLNEMKGERKIVAGQTQVRTKPSLSNRQDNEIHMPTSRIPSPPMIIPATPREATWFRKRSESGRKRRLRNRKSRKSTHPRSTLVDESVPSVEELTEMLEREMRLTKRLAMANSARESNCPSGQDEDDFRRAQAVELRELCDQAVCDFERGDFCHFETSYDEVTRRKKSKKREKRDIDSNSPIYVIRSWSNWIGTYSSNSTRVDRAPHFNSRNNRFAGVFLEPQQLASLSLTVSYTAPFTIHFKGWEASPGVRLRVCCDDYCPFSTDLKRTRKKWRSLEVECPADTKQLAFECENVGNRKGVCAVDDVFVAGEGCPDLDDTNPLTQ